MTTEAAVLDHSADEKRELDDRFHTLAERWKRETIVLSNPTVIENHPAYLEILQMGGDAVPLILKELAREPAWWFAALQDLTGAKPATAEMRGKLRLLTDAWLKWGREHGYEC